MATTAGLQPEFKRRVEAWLAEGNGAFYINSGYRSTARQAVLYAKALIQHGKNASKYVAKPGRSNHERGEAVDIGPKSGYAKAERLAAKHGLHSPMSHEPWHHERVDLANTKPGAYTPAPTQAGAEDMAVLEVVNYIKGLIPQGFIDMHKRFDGLDGLVNHIRSQLPQGFIDTQRRVDQLETNLNKRLDAIEKKIK